MHLECRSKPPRVTWFAVSHWSLINRIIMSHSSDESYLMQRDIISKVFVTCTHISPTFRLILITNNFTFDKWKLVSSLFWLAFICSVRILKLSFVLILEIVLILTFSVFMLNAFVTWSHLFTSLVNIINRFSSYKTIVSIDMIQISQTVTSIITIKTETGTGNACFVFELLTEKI